MKKMMATALAATALTASLSAAEKSSSVFDDFIAPVSNPVYFESPFHTTELRLIQMRQNFHDQIDGTVLGDDIALGGNMDMTALQIRYAVNDDFSIIATKDGYARTSFDNTLEDQSGFADLALGIKFTMVKCEDCAFMLTGGIRAEIPTGDDEVLQSNGSVIINPFLSAAKGFGNLHFIAYQGLELPLDEDENSTLSHTSLHIDYKLGDFYPLAEVNVRHVLKSGDGSSEVEVDNTIGGGVPPSLPLDVINPNIGGADIANVGGSDTQGQTDISYSVGFRYKLSENLILGAAYTGEVTSNDRGIFDDRLTADIIYQF